MSNVIRSRLFAIALVALPSACTGHPHHDAIRTDHLTVEPSEVTLATSGTQQFQARHNGAISTAVTWAATGGTVSATGLFTAPGSATTVTVTATSAADASVKATATVTVIAGTPQAATPTFSPAGGTFSSAQPVTIACTTTDSTIYYTTNGSTPTHGSPAYAGAIAVSATTTIQAICAANGYTDSSVASATFVIGSGTSATFSTGYYVYYEQDQLPLHQLHWADFTHLIITTGGMVKPLPGVTGWPDGDQDNTGPHPVVGSQDLTLLTATGSVSGSEAMAYFVQQAHGHGVAALIGLGGDAQHQFDAFDYNMSNATRRTQFADQLIAACDDWGFDGIDFDYEAPSAQAAAPWTSGSSGNLYTNFTAFLQELKSRRLAANHPTRPNQPVITTFPSGFATYGGMDSGYAAWIGTAAPYLDQVNPMTYVATMFSGGSVVWHQAPLHGATDATAWDIDLTLNALHDAGVPKEHLGIGLAAYGLNYHSSTDASARIGSSLDPFTVTTEFSESIYARHGGGGNVAYLNADGTPMNGGTLVHDTEAGATYIYWSYPGVDTWHTTLLSLDDAWAWQQKVSYVLQNGWGGVMVWSLQDGAHPDGTTPELDALAPLKAP